MKKVIVLLCIAVAATPVLADWTEADGHKMHFPQLPDEAGWDVNATFPVVLADDWGCSETGLVSDIHFWGSWKSGLEGEISSFLVRIHADIPDPDGEGPEFSKPGEVLWGPVEIADFTAVPIDPATMEGWYDPSVPLVLSDDHQAYFQYNIVDIPDPFLQMEGTIYWLSISANVAVDEPQPVWGWKSSVDHWTDDAVWGTDPGLLWDDLYEPEGFVDSLDLAFVITGPAIPTVSEWGLVVTTLLVLTAGTIVIVRRRAVTA